MEEKKRKPMRLPTYDYSLPGGYFITICTQKRSPLFWEDPDAVINEPSEVILSQIGKKVLSAIQNIPKIHASVDVDHYSIMPDHVHMLLILYGNDDSGQEAPELSTIVRQFKASVSKEIGKRIWQKSYYDHVIRNKTDYQSIVKYIYENPMNWKKDEWL